MATSRTQIINAALQSIAASTIADPDEDTESARQAKVVYDMTVRAETENYAWHFAKTQAVLPANAAPPAHKYANAYNLPSDSLRLVELADRWVFSAVRDYDANPVPAYELQGRAVMTDIGAPLRITYLRDVSRDPTQWSPLFDEVVAAALALKLAMPLTKSDGVVAMAEKLYARAVRRAVKANAIQLPPANVPDGSWVLVRLY